MFLHRPKRTTANGVFSFLELVYHSAVRSVRNAHGNAIMSLFISILQTVMMVLVFFVMFQLLGMRAMAIRGDYFLYLMSGVFLFMTHVKTAGAILGSEGPTSPMMQHAPMNTLISILSASLSSLYIQMLSLFVMLFVYHVGFNRIEIHDPVGALYCILLAWYTGIGVGLVFLAVKPWYPTFTSTANQLYTRVNLFASGKMMVGNSIPFYLLPFFIWNPLFHAIDQARGFIFINYFPHYSSMSYPFYVGSALILIGMLGEGYTRRHASLSWYAKR